MSNLRAILSRLSEVGLTTKPSKCPFAMAECTYLGHVVGNGVVIVKIEAVDQFRLPETKTQIRSFWD